MEVTMQKIINGIAIFSGAVALGVVGLGGYVFIRKDAIIDDIKQQAIESVLGGVGGGAAGGALKSIPSPELPLGTNDLPSAAPNQAAAPAPQAPVQF